MGAVIVVAAVWTAVAAPIAVVVGRALARRRRESERATSDRERPTDSDAAPERLRH